MVIMLGLILCTVCVNIFGGSSQVGTYLSLLVFACAAWIVGPIGSLLMGFAGAPGALLGTCDMRPWTTTYQTRRWIGLFLSGIGQSAIAVLFVVLSVSCVRHAISLPNTSPWILWIGGFALAMSPVKSACRQSRHEELINPEMVQGNILHMALGLPCIVTPVAFVALAVSPRAMSLFAWLPLTGHG